MMTTLIPAELFWLIDFAIQATIILVVALTVDWLISIRKRPVDSAAVWPACIVGLLVLPLLMYLMPTQVSIVQLTSMNPPTETVFDDEPERSISNIGQLESATDDQPNASTSEQVSNAAEATIAVKSNEVPSASTRSQKSSFGWLSVAFGLLGLGYLWMSFRLAVSIIRILSLKRGASATNNEVATSVYASVLKKLEIGSALPLLKSTEIRVPLVVGVLSPQVVLPTDLLNETNPESSTQLLETVLMHELTHIKRHDPIWNFLLELTTVLYWFHPLAWVARRRFADLREQACDDYCIYRLGGSSDYSEALIAIAARLVQPAETTSTLNLAAVRQPRLAKRIADINTSDGNSRFSATMKIHGTLMLSLLMVATTMSTVSTFATPIQELQAKDERHDEFEKQNREFLASLTANEKATMKARLATDRKDVKDKSAVLRMLLEKNKSNWERIVTWEGTFSHSFERVAEGEKKSIYGMRGRFSIDNENDLVFWDGVGPPAKKSPDGRTGIQFVSGPFDPRSTARVDDPSFSFLDNLTKTVRIEPLPGFWDCHSLTFIDSPSGKTYFFNSTVPERENKGYWNQEFVFAESVGFLLVSRKSYFSKADFDQRSEIEYKQVSGIFVPQKHTRKTFGGYGEHDVRDTFTTELFLSRLNDGLTFHHLYKVFRDLDLNRHSIRKRNALSKTHIDWNSAPDFARVINQDRIELRANSNGSLGEIVSVSGQGVVARYSDVKSFRQAIEAFCKHLQPEVVARMKIVLRVDSELNDEELERFKSEIKIDVEIKQQPIIAVP